MHATNGYDESFTDDVYESKNCACWKWFDCYDLLRCSLCFGFVAITCDPCFVELLLSMELLQDLTPAWVKLRLRYCWLVANVDFGEFPCVRHCHELVHWLGMSRSGTWMSMVGAILAGEYWHHCLSNKSKSLDAQNTLLGSANPCPNAVHMEPFSTSIFKIFI